MEAGCWSDYLCPWCYVGQDRDALLADLGVTVTHFPYELHPEIPPEGRPVRPDGRMGPIYDRIEAACDEVGLPFRRPTRMANTARALGSAEWVRRSQPERFGAVHAGLFAAAFARGKAIDDPDVVAAVLTDAGADATEAATAVASGQAAEWVAASMTEARRHGITGTPSWLLPGGLVLPGALDRDTVTRWVTRLRDRPT